MGEKSLAIRPGRLDDDARAAYAKTLQPGKTDTTGGLYSVEDLLRGAELFEVCDGDQVIGRYALRVKEWSGGLEGVLVAGVGRLPGVSLGDAFLPVMEQQLAGVDCLMTQTRRKAWAAKLIAHGWTVEGFILRKRVKR